MDQKNNDFIVVIKFLLRWKLPLIIFGVLGALVGAIFSGPTFITPMYDSQVIFYPSNTMSISKALVAEKSYSDNDFLSIGEDEEAEQLLQLLQSDIIVELVKAKFNLMEHYNIDLDTKYANTKFKQKFDKNFKSELTKYMSIRVRVRDKDPELAAKMATDVVEIMDSLRNNILKNRAYTGLRIVKKDYQEKVIYVNSIIDSLSALGKMGIMKLEQQAEVLTKAYTDALLKNHDRALKDIDAKIKLISKYGPIQEALAAELEFETEQLVDLRTRLKEIQLDAQNDVPTIFYIENARVAERKSYPVRWVVTFLSAFGTILFCIVLFILIEQLRNAKFDD